MSSRIFFASANPLCKLQRGAAHEYDISWHFFAGLEPVQTRHIYEATLTADGIPHLGITISLPLKVARRGYQTALAQHLL